MKKFILLFLSLSALTACNHLDFAFYWADTYIASRVDEFFDISSQQKSSLKNSLKSDLNKIKVEVIPAWIKDVQQLKDVLNSGALNKEDISIVFTSIFKNLDRLTATFKRTALEFALSINQKQFEYFAKTFHSKNEEDLNNDTDEKIRKKYFNYFEMFLGSINKQQKELIETSLRSNPFPKELKLKNNEWIFKQFMEQRSSQTKLKQFVSDYFQQPEKFQLPEYRQALQHYYEGLQNLIKDISSVLTSRQKEDLIQNLTDKLQQLQKIAVKHG
ncbi:MAG: DUF6279 family lipoprotein [Pseudobdellovibrionaceae bacterium]